MRTTPRVAAIHDLSAFGRCSLTIVIPTLSAMGVQCCPVPTAYLSTHTGGFGANTFLDLTDQMGPVLAHWKSFKLTFDAVYTGYMGGVRQSVEAAGYLEAFRGPGCLAVVDPVLGDHGAPYRGITPEICAAARALADQADVLVPNRTEAALLLGADYGDICLDREADCRRWAEALSRDGRRSVVLKGVSLAPGTIGAVCFDRDSGQTGFVSAPLAPGAFHGTGDLFASVLTGALVTGKTLSAAAQLAADFTALCARRTAERGLPEREGIDFEPLLYRLYGLMR